MFPEKQSLKPDMVSSIFSRKGKRRFSSLFGQRQIKTDSGVTVIKKVFPFGLDIGTSSVKLVQLGCDREGAISIINSTIEELPKEAQTHNSKERQNLLVQALKKVIADKGLKGDCFVSTPYIYTKVNLIKLPPMPPNEIDKAVQWEIRQSSRLDLPELCFDYIILDRERIKFLGNQIGILVITALKKDIFAYLALLESVGLTPQAIDIEPLADLAVLNYAQETRFNDEVVLWLDLGAGKTALNIICNNELISLRYLSVNGNSLTKALSGYSHLSWEESELMKKNFGVSSYALEQSFESPSDKTVQTRNAILPLLENMAQDIEHTFKYFSYQIAQSQITRFDKIILSGGSSHIKGLVSFLRDRLNVEVTLVDSLINLDALGTTAHTLRGFIPRLSVALGLALRGLE